MFQRADGVIDRDRYFEKGFRILDPAGRAYSLWLVQPPEEKRKLLNLVRSNCTFDGVSLTASYRKPFCWFAEGLSRTSWLPESGNCENLVLRSTFPLSPGTVETLPPPPKRKLTRPPIVPVAFEFQRLLASGEVKNRAELARRFRMSRARVSQIMNILDLPSPIVDYLSTLFHDDKCRFTERRLRRIVGLPTEEEQVTAFEELRKAVEGTKTPTVTRDSDNGDGKRARPVRPADAP